LDSAERQAAIFAAYSKKVRKLDLLLAADFKQVVPLSNHSSTIIAYENKKRRFSALTNFPNTECRLAAIMWN
jgi:hypothetical protein